VSKIKKQHESALTKQSTVEHFRSKNAAVQVRTEIKHTPVQMSTSNASSSSNIGHQRQSYRAMDNDVGLITGDEVSETGNVEPVNGWSRSSFTLSFQLRGRVVELHLTRSTSQASHGKVFVAERGRIKRWIPRSSKDVSYIVCWVDPLVIPLVLGE